MAEKVDLNQLRERLAKLGVQIDVPAEVGSTNTRKPRPAARQATDSSWETHLDRSSKEVAQLLDRCNKVHQALNRSADSSADEQQPVQAAAKSGTSKAAAAVATAATAVRAVTTAAACECKPQAAGRPAASSSRVTAAANTAVAAAAAVKSSPAKDSKLLVRAAQRLLRSAQVEAEQVDRALSIAVPTPAAAQPAAAAPAKANSAAAERGSPLGTVLAQYKEAQAAWAQEKAKLRREAVTNRKKASKLELDMAKLQRLHQHKTLDVSSLRAALKGRDVQLEEAHTRIKQLEEALAKSQEVAAEKLCGLAAERDDLQALLLATLQRLEGVEAVVAAADATSAAMEDKVRVLEDERQAALELAHAAKAELTHVKEEQRRLQWQSQLLEKMSEVQLRHNKRKSAAIKELLSAAGGEAGGSSGEAGDKQSRGGEKQHRSPGNPSAVLQGLLDGLLENDEDDAAGDNSAPSVFEDGSTLASEY